MNVIVRYDRVDFFGCKQFTEDSKNDVNFSDLKKVFSRLKADKYTAVVIDNYVLYWDNFQNFEHGLLSCKESEGVNSYKEYEWDFDGCKKFFYDMTKNKQ